MYINVAFGLLSHSSNIKIAICDNNVNLGIENSSSGVPHQQVSTNVYNSMFDSSIGTENVISLQFISDVYQ